MGRGALRLLNAEFDNWDLVDGWTRRIVRWAAFGIPTWFVLLLALNQNLTGIPWIAGLSVATVGAIAVALIADKRRGEARTPLGPFGRATVAWLIAFLVFALGMTAANVQGAAIAVIPFLGATLVAGGVELWRRAVGRH